MKPLSLTPVVYAIRHVESGRVYVGSAERVSMRWKKHRWALKAGRHDNVHLQRAWVKYGPAAFAFEIIEHVEDAVVLIEREQFWIDELRATGQTSGFNLCPVAGSRKGKTQSIETRAKIGAAFKGRRHTPETKAKMRLNNASRRMSRLSVDDVAVIKAALQAGVIETKLAANYGVSRSAINAIRLGATWRDVKPASADGVSE